MKYHFLADGQSLTVKMILGKFKYPLGIRREGKRLWLEFSYNPDFNKFIKECFTGYKWHGRDDPPVTQWSIADSQHNWWQLAKLQGFNPYAPYDAPLQLADFSDLEWKLPAGVTPYSHQIEGASIILQYHYVIEAYEMGLGKTLMAMLAAAKVRPEKVLWVAPNSALISVQLEARRWKFPYPIEFVSCSSLAKLVANWPKGKRVWQFVVFDESSRYKNETSQRSKAAKHIADQVRAEWGENGYVVELTGSPAPLSGVDWYSQCEIAQPGFLKEGSEAKLKERLAIIEKREGEAGGSYPVIVAWRDSDKRCATCGQLADAPSHDPVYAYMPTWHPFTPGINELAKLHDRMKGLVWPKFKKDCLCLPEKIYKEIELEAKPEIIRAAEIIISKQQSTIAALTELRELSDGFQYRQDKIGEETCPLCMGTGDFRQQAFIGNDDQDPDVYTILTHPDMWQEELLGCPTCHGKKVVDVIRRVTEQIPTPKEEGLLDIMNEYENTRRMVVWAGFTGALERINSIVLANEWQVITVIEGKWANSLGLDKLQAMEAFQDKSFTKRLCFIAYPGSGGMGITLTRSQASVYWSNSYNAEDRIQSEDRIHRAGMDPNSHPCIFDLIHLATDRMVLKNIRGKREMQHITLTKESLYERPD